MNIIHYIANLFKRKQSKVAVSDVFDIRVRIKGNGWYSFGNLIQGKVYPARRVGSCYAVCSRSLADSIPEGSYKHMEHVASGAGHLIDAPYWSFLPTHVEEL